VRTYKHSIQQFLKFIYPNATETSDELSDRYIAEDRDYEADIQGFLNAISDKPPKTIRLYLAATKNFLIESGVELPQRFWKRLSRRIKGSTARTQDVVPTNEELKRILMHMPIHGRALFLTLSSSGMRIGEALKLTMQDVNLEKTPITINIRGETTKTGDRRTTFISREAGESIREWLKTRGKYLRGAAGRSHRYSKSETDPRLFPFEVATAYSMWNTALDRTGNGARDSSTNRRKLHPHVLRKFFRSTLPKVISLDVVEALMGHSGYLTDVYRRYQVKDLADFYLRGEHLLTIFGNGSDVGKLRAEVEEKNTQLQTLVNGLTTENMSMKERMQDLTKENQEFKRTIQSLKDGDVKSIQQQTERFDQQIQALTQDKQTLEQQVVELSENNQVLNDKVDYLKTDMTEVRENWDLGDKMIEKIQFIYFMFLEQQYSLKAMSEEEYSAWHDQMREKDEFFREIVDRDLIRTFATWQREE
jgi:integrase